jgi:hypothetical protein
MTPEQLIQNATTLAQTLMPGGGTLTAIVGTLAYGYGKALTVRTPRWGKNGWLGAGVPSAGPHRPGPDGPALLRDRV